MAALCSSLTASAQGSAVLTGLVTDTNSKQPVSHAEVIATSSALQGTAHTQTDGSGVYWLPQLPAGTYALTITDREHAAYQHANIELAVGQTSRVDARLLALTVENEELLADGHGPTVDVGAASAGLSVTTDFASRVPLLKPNSFGTRSFEQLAQAAPQVFSDGFGPSISGASSPENLVLLDGLSVNDPALGVIGTNLPVDFIEAVDVVTGGSLPEHGRFSGGVLRAITKSGSNEFHGSVFGNVTPGALTGGRPALTAHEGTFTHHHQLWNAGDFGVELGGPIIKHRLWFYAGLSPSLSRAQVRRTINQLSLDSDGNEVLEPVPGGTSYRFVDARSYSYLGKLTWRMADNHSLVASASGSSGRASTPTFNERQLAGDVATNDAFDLSLTYSGAALQKHLLFDAMVGWHHQLVQQLPDDGTGFGSTSGAGGTPATLLRKSSPFGYGIRDVETLPPAADGYCEQSAPQQCPVTDLATSYAVGGALRMKDARVDRTQAKLALSYLLDLAGHHVFKGGGELVRSTYDVLAGPGGGTLLVETPTGSALVHQGTADFSRRVFSSSTELGAFLQDSWALLDAVTLSFGLRYDQQYLYDGSGAVALLLKGMWSPRLGLVYDFTQQGRSKLYGSYARYYGSVPLAFVDARLNGLERGRLPLDPSLVPQSSDEMLVGAEYELFSHARVGLQYTKRWLNDALEDVSTDDGATAFIGNPGRGLAKELTPATRLYDAVTLSISKAFADSWQAQASYTWSHLRGNYAGLIDEQRREVSPHTTADFDAASLMTNRTGDLPGDHRHAIKAFAAKELTITSWLSAVVGLGYHSRSGSPVSAFAASSVAGVDQSFVLPRGAVGTTGWVHSVDLKAAALVKVTKEQTLTVSVDVFNLFNLAAVESVDQRLSSAAVQPYTGAPEGQSECRPVDSPACAGQLTKVVVDPKTGVPIGHTAASAADLNAHYRQTIAYQQPLTVRIGVKLSF